MSKQQGTRKHLLATMVIGGAEWYNTWLLAKRKWCSWTERIAMKTDIHLVDRGRGLQLSTCRITVQDLVPYFQEGCSYEQIIRWIPTLTVEEIAVVERYYRAHQAALDDEDRLIRNRIAERVQQQRSRFPEFEGTPEERLARLRLILEKQRQEKNGERNSG